MITDPERMELEQALWSKSVPEHLHGGLMRYVTQGIPPGDFLEAVLSNDLRESFGRADETSRAGLFNIVLWLYNDAPRPCWGSPERYRAWLAQDWSKTR